MTDPSLGYPAPRYQLVAQSLMNDIAAGRFKVGDRLPTELQICEQFGVSRHTAREAIRRLADAGMLTRRAGVGTTVKAGVAQARYTASVSDFTELFAFNRQARLEILAEESIAVEGETAHILPDAVGQRWYRFTALRHVAGTPEPIVHTHILMSPGYEGVRERIREPGVMVYELIEQLHGERIVELRQEISCVRTPKKIADLLGTRSGAPALRVLRYYVGPRDNLLSVAVNTYPDERFKLTTRWRLDRNNHGQGSPE